jgi:hypothetical protein
MFTKRLSVFIVGLLMGACASLAPQAAAPSQVYSTFSPGGDLGSPASTNVSQTIKDASIDLAGSKVTGNLPVSRLNSGTGADSTKCWTGNATWQPCANQDARTFLAGYGVPSTAGVSGQYYLNLQTGRVSLYTGGAWATQNYYLNITQDPPVSSGLSKIGIYLIGGATRDYQNTSVVTYMGKTAVSIISMYSGWQADQGTTAQAVYAAVAALNPDTVLSAYTDSTRTQLPGYKAQIIANNQYVANSYPPAGDPALWLGDYVTNYASTATSGGGLLASAVDADYRWLTYHTGGAEGFTANSYNKSTYWDDVFGNSWYSPGLWTAGNVGANPAMRAGWKAAFTRYRADAAAVGVTAVVASNASQMYCCMDAAGYGDYAGTLDVALVERIGGETGGTWFGGGGWVGNYNTRIVPLLTASGKAVFDSEFLLESVIGTTAFNKGIRYTAGACFTITNALYGPLIDHDMYYLPLPQYLVWRQFFDVDLTTGIAKTYGASGLGFAWMGNPVDPPQIAGGANGLVVRKFDHAYVVANPTDTGGAQTWTAPERVKLIQAADDPVFNGTVVPAGGTYSIPYQDALFFIPWSGAWILPFFVLTRPRSVRVANDDEFDTQEAA